MGEKKNGIGAESPLPKELWPQETPSEMGFGRMRGKVWMRVEERVNLVVWKGSILCGKNQVLGEKNGGHTSDSHEVVRGMSSSSRRS